MVELTKGTWLCGLHVECPFAKGYGMLYIYKAVNTACMTNYTN